jgi:predicted nucleic acid-binding protein
MCPVVLAELLSDPLRSYRAITALLEIPLLELKDGFWMRASLMRHELLKLKLKPKLADTLIAQVCIDHNIPLHARDAGFRPFAKHFGLQLVLHGLIN